MIAAFTELLIFQLLGELLTHFFALPLPGPVLGMALLFGWLVLRGGPSHDMTHTAGTLSRHFSLLFIPAGAGVLLQWQRVSDEWLPIVAATVVSTFLAMAVTALVLQALLKRRKQEESS